MSDDLSLKTLAGIPGLSPSRFMHAFTESVGVPGRRYNLWLRLQRTARDLLDGTSVHERGSSSRVLRRRTPDAHVSSHARRDTVGPCLVE